MDFRKQLNSALVIEQHPLAQSHLKYSLHHMGFEQVSFVDRSQQAVTTLESNQFDLIICAYDLNKGADGYQLFEKIVLDGLVKSTTTFVFLSSENSLPVSQSVIELKPDDFILKPFTTKQLELRLNRVLEKKLALRPVFKALDKQDHKQALSELNQHISSNTHPRWMPFLMKLKGEIILEMETWQVGETFFNRVCKLQPYPWAKQGLVECLLGLNKLSAAEKLLNAMLSDAKTKLAALDYLAQLHKQRQEYDKAHSSIKEAVTLSPRNIVRQKELVELARFNHDFESQYNASNDIVRYVRHSVHESPELYLSAVRSAIDYGLTTTNEEELTKLSSSSEKILSSVKRIFPESALDDQIQVAQARLANLKNDRDQAVAIIEANKNKTGHYEMKNLDDALDKAKAFHELGFHRDSEKVFEEIDKLCHNADNPVFSQYIKNEKQLRIEIKESPKELNRRAIQLFKQGKLKDALDAFQTAFKVMPHNPSIALNLMQTLIESGYNKDAPEEANIIINLCQRALSSTQLDEEQQARYKKLTAMME